MLATRLGLLLGLPLPQVEIIDVSAWLIEHSTEFRIDLGVPGFHVNREGTLDRYTPRIRMGASSARYAVERHRWAEAAALSIPPNTFPGGRAAWTEANLHFARALGASRTGQIDVAEKEVHQLASLRDTLTQINDSYWADQVDMRTTFTTRYFVLNPAR
jgi:hypothetical protein